MTSHSVQSLKQH